MASKKPIKKVVAKAKVVVKPAAKKAVAKPIAKKPAVKPVTKAPAKNVTKVAVKPLSKAPAKPVVKVTAKPIAKKPAAKIVTKPVVKAKPAAKTPVKPAAKAPVKPVAKAPVKPIAKSPIKKVDAKKVVSPVKKAEKPVVKASKPEKVKKPAKVKAEKPKKAPKPEKVKKPIVPALSPKEIAKQKAVAREALEKELSKKMPEPPPPIIHKRKVEDKNKKPIVIPKVNAKTSQPYKPDFTRSIMDAPKQKDSGPLVRYSDNELTEFREIISRKLDAAKRELAYLQGLITRKDEMGGDADEGHYMTMEDGSMSMEREQLSQMASRQITYIDHLEKAVMRIENKTYGICRVTGKLIDKARLRAVPHATLSIEAKMMQK
jgi:RNA polymerase-binding transcription factor DksA